MKVNFVNLSREANLIENELVDATRLVLRSGNYICGENVKTFEENFSLFCGVNHSVSVGNGSDGLKIIMKALDIGQGDEVICPANSFIASAWSIIDAGATPVFCDVEDDFLISLETIEKCKSSKTKAIMAVHLTGKLCDTDKLLNYCRNENIFLIEDAAQSVGAMNNRNEKSGSFGIAGSFSMHPLKNLSVYGDGGIVTTNSEDLAIKMKKLRNHGLVNRDEANLWGFNSRLDEMQAAFALIKLKKLNMWNEKYIDIAKTYTENLSDKIVKPITKSGYKDVFHNYIIVVPEEIRDDFMNSLHDIGIESKIHYPIPLHLQKCATSLGYKKGDIPNAERLSNSMISLPIYHTLTSNEIEYVVESVNKLVETYL
tara:strand:+ start:3037 stop:4149 length:1113 start_codon:yes stop_codon:yes gene_type:complete